MQQYRMSTLCHTQVRPEVFEAQWCLCIRRVAALQLTREGVQCSRTDHSPWKEGSVFWVRVGHAGWPPKVCKGLCGEWWSCWVPEEAVCWPEYWPKLCWGFWAQCIFHILTQRDEPPHPGNKVPRCDRSILSMRHNLLLWLVVGKFGRDKSWHVTSASPWHCCLNNIVGWTCFDEAQDREVRTDLLPGPWQGRLNHSHIPPWLDFAYAKPPTVRA